MRSDTLAGAALRRTPGKSRLTQDRLDAVHRLLILGGLLVLWQVVTVTGLVSPQTLPQPLDVLRTLAEVITTQETWIDIRVTMTQVALSLGISVVLGTTLGILAWQFKMFLISVYPWLSAANAVPGLLFYPLAIVLVGLGTPSIVLLASLLGTLTMAELMLAGLKGIRPVYLEVARSLEASRSAIFRQVIIPAAFTVLIAALRVTSTLAFIVTIASQYILSGAGIGYRLRFAYELFNTEEVYAFVVIIIITSLAWQYLLIFLLGRLRGAGNQSRSQLPAPMPV